MSTTSAYFQRLTTSFLLVGLLFSLSANLGVRSSTSQREGESTPTFIRSATGLVRNYALTTVPVQRTASDTAKQNRVRHPVVQSGLAPRESGVPATTLRQLLVNTDRSVSYLSFRLSLPGGRAPPPSA